MPGDLGNTLRLARSANDIAFSWGELDDQTTARENLIRARNLGNTDAQAVLDQYFP